MLYSRQLVLVEEETADVGLAIHLVTGSKAEDELLTGRSRRLGLLVCMERLGTGMFRSRELDFWWPGGEFDFPIFSRRCLS